MAVVDDIKAAFADARPILADAFHGDTYEIWRDTLADTGRGTRKPTPTLVESGTCKLEAANAQAQERQVGFTLGMAIAPYSAELTNTDTVLKATDRMRINGRDFQVISVRRGGVLQLFPVAQLEDWTA